nr:hypothetical protein [uncultured Rhodopila sp.]
MDHADTRDKDDFQAHLTNPALESDTANFPRRFGRSGFRHRQSTRKKVLRPDRAGTGAGVAVPVSCDIAVIRQPGRPNGSGGRFRLLQIGRPKKRMLSFPTRRIGHGDQKTMDLHEGFVKALLVFAGRQRPSTGRRRPASTPWRKPAPQGVDATAAPAMTAAECVLTLLVLSERQPAGGDRLMPAEAFVRQAFKSIPTLKKRHVGGCRIVATRLGIALLWRGHRFCND